MSQMVWKLGLHVVYFVNKPRCWYCADIDPAWHITTCLQGLSVNNMPFYFSVASCGMIRPRCCPLITGKSVTCSPTILGGFSKLSWIHESVLLRSSQLTNWGQRICILGVHCTVSVHHAGKPYHLVFFFHSKCEHRFKHNLLHADTDDISCVSIVVWPGMISLLVSHGLIMISLNIFNEILCSLHRFIQKYPTLNTEGQLWRKSDTVLFPSYFHKCALQQDIRTENTMQILPHPQKPITLDVSNCVNFEFVHDVLCKHAMICHKPAMMLLALGWYWPGLAHYNISTGMTVSQ